MEEWRKHIFRVPYVQIIFFKIFYKDLDGIVILSSSVCLFFHP